MFKAWHVDSLNSTLSGRKDIVLKWVFLVLISLFVLKFNNLLLILLFKFIYVFCLFNITNNKVYYFVLVFINSFIQYQRRELKSTKKGNWYVIKVLTRIILSSSRHRASMKCTKLLGYFRSYVEQVVYFAV